MAAPRYRLPVRLVIIDVIGGVMAGAGFFGLIDGAAADKLPFLAIPGAAPALLILGVGLMGYAIGAMLGGIRAAVRRANAEPGSPRR